MLRFGWLHRLVEGDTCRRPSAFRRVPGACALYEDLAHGEGGNGHEMRTVLESPRALPDQPDERFVHERRGLQGLAGPLAVDVAGRQAAELFVDERHQLGDRLLVAAANLLETACRAGRSTGVFQRHACRAAPLDRPAE